MRASAAAQFLFLDTRDKILKFINFISLSLLLSVAASGCLPVPGAGGQAQTLSINDVAPELASATALNPFTEGVSVTYKTFNIEQVDAFSQSSAKLLGMVMVAEKMREVAANFGEGLDVGSFNDATALGEGALAFARRVVEQAQALQTQGQELLGNISSIAASEPLKIPAITAEVTDSLSRITDALSRATSIVGG